ncbi:MAG: helix-turn-helix transcriptional regulator [Prevotella sp.]|nr:helix-turn-helix transcriptional regulator [Candidatus Prevotella equi]
MQYSNLRFFLGKRITEIREKKGMSVEELAARADLQPGHIRRIEMGKYKYDVDILAQIALALGVSLDFVEYQE